MWKKLSLIALAVFAFGFASAPRSNAGTEMLTDNFAPAPTYDYAPPPPPRVYYAPPPVRVVVYPGYAYCAPRFRAYGYQRFYGRRPYWHGHHRR